MIAHVDAGNVSDEIWRQKPLRAVSIPDVLTPEQCDIVKRDALATGLNKPLPPGGEGGRDSNKRTCHEVFLPQTPERDWLYETILAKTTTVNQDNWRFAVTGIEKIRAIRYGVGGRFAWHFDSHIGSPRKLTCVVSLSPPEAYWRGGLEVKGHHEGRKIAPLQGAGTWFPAYLEHRGRALWYGERWILLALFTGPAWV